MSSAARQVTYWRRKRDAANEAMQQWIVTMSEDGAPLSEIAEAAGMSKAGVAKVLARTKEKGL